jgi:hypothetical protein
VEFTEGAALVHPSGEIAVQLVGERAAASWQKIFAAGLLYRVRDD